MILTSPLLITICAAFVVPITKTMCYINCPTVSLTIPYDTGARSHNPQLTRGSILRASSMKNNIPRLPDACGRKQFSSKSGLALYVHRISVAERFVSIRWKRNVSYALAVEKGKLQFKVTTMSETPADKFLFMRKFLIPEYGYVGFQSKLTNRYITYTDQDCSVSLASGNQNHLKNHYFVVKCKPDSNMYRCFCFQN